MNPIIKALDEVTYRIPAEILKVVFLENNNGWRESPTNIRDKIREKVLEPRVLVDCNLVGGTEVLIPLDGLLGEQTDVQYSVVYRIPKSMTDGRSITSVMNITYANANMSAGHALGPQNSVSPALQVASNVMDAQLRTPYMGTASVQLIGENVVMIRDAMMIPGNLYLRCVLENDATLSHIQLRSYRVFSKLVELAVKAFIYNNYFIKLDENQLRAGMAVGAFKTIVDGFADAEQNYQDHLTEKWAKTAFMNDRESMSRFTRLLIGGSR